MINYDYPDGATPLDLDETEGLLLTHITTRGELDRWEQDNIIEAIAWLDKTKPTDILNEQFIKKLHKHMFGDAWKWAGQFRQSDKNIGGPWYNVAEDLRNLCEDVRLWIEDAEESEDEIGVRFHHRLVSIHAFPNGNGRHARLMTDLLIENILGSSRFSWGSKDLSEAGDFGKRYITALQAADRGDYKLLQEFVRT